MPLNDKEVFDLLKSDPNTSPEIDFITYAIYAFEKYQWYDQFVSAKGHAPSATEIDSWIEDLTTFRFRSMREEAARFFDDSARIYLADDIEQGKRLAVEHSIVAEVKAAGGFWRQMSIALITAILAPLLIGAVIVAAFTFDKIAPTATDVTRVLKIPAEPVTPAPIKPVGP